MKHYDGYLDRHAKHDFDWLEAQKAQTSLRRKMDQIQAGSGDATVADKLVLWNTHNYTANDRGSTRVNVIPVSQAPRWFSGATICPLTGRHRRTNP